MPDFYESTPARGGMPTRMERHEAHGHELTSEQRGELLEQIGLHGGWPLNRDCPRCHDPRCEPRVSAWAALAHVGLLDPIEQDPTAAIVRRAE